MPREIDAYPRNLKLTHDPTMSIGVTPAQLKKGMNTFTDMASDRNILMMLRFFDSITGWDLVDCYLDNKQALEDSKRQFQNEYELISAALALFGKQLWDWIVRVANDIYTGNVIDLTDALFGDEAKALVVQGEMQAWQAGKDIQAIFRDLEDFVKTGDWNDLSDIVSLFSEILFGTKHIDPETTMSVTIDHTVVAYDMQNVPVRIDLGDMPVEFWYTVDEGGGDIRCYDSNDNELPREVVYCHVSVRMGELFVKTDLSKDFDTVITIKANGLAVPYARSETFGAESVWNDGYHGVWHMDHVSTIKDSSSNHNNGTVSGTVTLDHQSPVGTAVRFTGGQYFVVPHDVSLYPRSTYTLTAVAKSTQKTTQYIFDTKGGTAGTADAGGYLIGISSNDNSGDFFAISNGDNVSNVTTGKDETFRGTGQWCHLGFVFDGTSQFVYINGELAVTLPAGIDAITATLNDLQIGMGHAGKGFVGELAEVRLDDNIRDQEWIRFQYRNLIGAQLYSVSLVSASTAPTDIQMSALPPEWQAVVNDMTDFLATGDWSDIGDAWSDLNQALWGTSEIGSKVKTSVLPDAWQTVINDVVDFLATGSWSDIGDAWVDLNQAIWGSDNVGSLVKHDAIPSGIPQSKIKDLETQGNYWTAASDHLNNFLTLGNWAQLSDAWSDINQAIWGTDIVGTKVQKHALPDDWSDVVDDISSFLFQGDWSSFGAAWRDLNQAIWGTNDVGSKIQNSTLPSSFENIGQDFLNLVNDVIYGDGRTWADIGPDLNALISDFLGGNSSHSVTPGQIPAGNVSSVGGGASIGTDVAGAQGAANSAGKDASDTASKVSRIVSPDHPSAPTWLIAWPQGVESGHPGVGQAGDDVWYRVTAVNAAGESVASNTAYAHALFGPIGVKLTWVASDGATKYHVYRGISSNPFLIAPSEPSFSEYAEVGNVTSWTDEGD